MLLPLMPFFVGEFTTATRTTTTAGSYVNGEWVPGTTTQTTINVTYPQPVRMDELNANEQGERITDFVKVYSDSLISTRLSAADADTVTVLGETYKVWAVDSRPIGAYRKVVLRRVL